MDRLLADRYRLDRRIGGGGMGAVFAAEDQVLQRPVAVKLLPGLDTGDRGFLREARALSRLRHPGIVRLFDAGADNGDAYLVLELVDGRTLAQLMAQGPIDSDEVQRIGRELAEALAHAHSLGVVHRDLSPANVLIDEGGRVRLTDFGIARLADTTATSSGEVWGTPAFMAPEQVSGQTVGPPADVYALGLVLLEALTGERVFPGPAHEASLARLHRDAVVPDELPGAWPPLLRAMTARNPEDRPYAVSVASRLGAPRQVLRTLAMPVNGSGRAGVAAAGGVAAGGVAAGGVAAAAGGDSVGGAAAERTAAGGGASTAALPWRAPPLGAQAWWARPGTVVAGLLLLSALLLGLALAGDEPGLTFPATTATPTVSPPSPTAPPPENDDGEDKDEKDDDGEGRGKGNGKGRGKDDGQ